MAVSTTSDYNLTGTELINSVFRLLGVFGTGETVPSDDTTNALQALNIILKSIQKKGINLWARDDVTVAMTASNASVQIGAAATGTDAITASHKPLRVLEAYLRTGTSDSVLELLSMQEYYQLGNKTQSGTPTSIYVDHGRNVCTIYFYPIPTSADTSNTIRLVTQRTLLDVDTAADNIDIPQEWFQTLKWLLAAELGPEYGIDLNRQQMIEQKANMYLAEASSFDEELETSVYFGVSR